jgi:hypothetical protein
MTAESVTAEAEATAFLGAIHNVLQSRRSSTEADLLAAAACQFLNHGRAPLKDVVDGVSTIWPGVPASAEQIRAALELSRDLGLAGYDVDADEWFLTAHGADDIGRHSQWVNELRGRVTADIRRRSRDGLQYEPDGYEAELWLDVLVKALVVGIEESQAVHLGHVERLVHGNLAPRVVDQAKLLERLNGASPRAEIVELLKSLAIAALDPLDPFGKELVSHITTGCILHAYVSGRTGKQITDTIGSPRGQRAILDTPVLISLVGPASDQDDMLVTINSALASGWDVVVCQHSLEELTELITREIPRIEKRFREALETNTKLEFYAALVEDQIHGICIAALKDNTYTNLQAMLAACHALKGRLESLGVHVRHHNNEISPDRRATCLAALNEQLSKSPHFRSATVVGRDADTLAMAWRRRRRESSKNWPGAWVITSDRSMAAAYGAISTDRVSITLSPSQWTTVVALSAEASDLVSLASAAAGQFAEESMWQLPARFPGDFAMGLATQLSPDQGGSDLDLRQAQLFLSIPEMLDKIEAESSPMAVASAVLASRTRRIDNMAKRERERHRDALAMAEIAAGQAEKAALEAQVREQKAAADRTQLESELAAEKASSATKDTELNAQKTRHKRILISIALTLASAAFAVAAAVFGTVIHTAISACVLVVCVVVCLRWCRDLSLKFSIIVWMTVLETVGFASAIMSFFPSGEN